MNEPCRVRIRFGKEGDLRFISHRDLVRAMERMFRRAGLELAMTQGFHPRPRMTFPAALALGVTARHEVAELVLARPHDARELLAVLRETAPPGLVVHDVEVRGANEPKVSVRGAVYEMEIPVERREALARDLAEWQVRDRWEVQRDGGAVRDFRPAVLEIDFRDGLLRFKLDATQNEAMPRADELLDALGLGEWQAAGLELVRADLELAS